MLMVIIFGLQNKRDNFEFLTEVFNYELTVIDESKWKRIQNYLHFEHVCERRMLSVKNF